MPQNHRRDFPQVDQPAPAEGDVIAEIYDHVMAGADPSELRRIFSGDRVYVALKPRLSREQRKAIQDELKTHTAPEVARKHKISVRHCHRLRKLIRRDRDRTP